MGELNIKSSTIEKGIELAKELLGKIASPAVEEFGLMFGDNVKLWRLRNQIRNLEKVKEIIESENVTLKQVNLKVLFPYLEGVALEDDEELQTLWANLFANYIDSSKNLVITVYPSILKQLSTNEVKILKDFNLVEREKNELKRKGMYEEVQRSGAELYNLERLGLINEDIVFRTPIARHDSGNDKIEGEPTGNYFLTNFGYEFLIACTRKQNL